MIRKVFESGVVIFLVSLLLMSGVSGTYTYNFGEELETDEQLTSNGYPFPEYYPSVEELYDWYEDLEDEYPNLVEKHKYGESYEGRDLWVIEITSDQDTQVEEKPAVLIDGAIHAREWSSTQVASYFMWRVLDEYESNETINWLVNNRRIFVSPMTNPDGYIFDGDGEYPGDWWRKNRNDSTPNPGKISIGVDLNRNWDISWDDGNDDPSSDTYRGEAPFSEPETKNLKEFILENDIDSYQNLHSYADCLLIPYMHTTDPSPHDDWYRGMADNMTSLTTKYGEEGEHYSYGQPHEEIGYSAPGGAADWVYEETGAHGLVFEIYTAGNAFYPPEDDIMTINNDLDDSLIYQSRIADTDLGDGENIKYPPVPHLLYGTVKDEDNETVEGTEVKIINQETDEKLSITTDSNGYYEFNLGNLVDDGYEIGDELSIKVDSETQTDITIDDTWGQRIDIEAFEPSDPISFEDIPMWEIGSSWTYNQNLWYNDTDSEEYLHIEEEFTYTVDEVGFYTLNETEYYGYNLSLDGEVLDGEGEIETDDFGMVEIDIEGGTISGYMFCKMSDLGVVVDDQFRNIEGDAYPLGLPVDFESWTKLTNHYDPPVEEYDFPLNTTEEKFWSNTTSYSSGYNSYKIFGFIEENETINETFEMNSESYSPYSEKVQVPAGEFEAIYLNSTQIDEESYRERWYEPEVKSYVKEKLDSPEADWIRELVDSEVPENTNNLSFEPSEAWIEDEVLISGEFPNYANEKVTIQIPEGGKPQSEWNVTLDGEGKFEKWIEVPAALDMTETNIDFSSVGFVAEVDDEDETEYAVATLVIHHDNSPVYPDPPDEAEDVNLDVELSAVVAHEEADKLNVTFHDASDDSIIDSEKNVSNGDYSSIVWTDLKADTTYEWYANVSEWGNGEYWNSEIWEFTTLETYDLSIDSGDGGLVKEPGQETFEYEAGQIVDLEAIADEGYHFSEWTGDNQTIEDTKSNETTIEMLDNYTIVAEFDTKTYNLTIGSTDGGSVVEPGEYTFEYVHGEIVDLEAVADEGYHFSEWTGDNQTIEDTKSNETTIDMLDNYSITAEFSTKTHELTVDSSEGGEVVEPGEGTFQYEHGEVVDLEAVADEGYHFSEWTGDNQTIEDTEENQTTIEMLDNYSITAEFSIDTYELTVDSTDGGEVVEPGEGTFEYTYGEFVELEAVADEGFYFSEWIGDNQTIENTEENQTTIEMLEDYSITAEFLSIEYELTITSTEGGEVIDPGEGTFGYQAGEIVELESISDEGYHFVEWIGDNETIDDTFSNKTTIEMMENYSIIADFSPITYELNIDSTEGGEVINPGEGTFKFEYGKIIDLEALSSEGHNFVEWTGDNETIGDPEAKETNIEILGNYYITVTFEKKTYQLTIGSTEGGHVEEPDEGTFQYEYGELVSLIAESEDGYEFVEWIGDNETVQHPSERSTEVLIENNIEIMAEFEINTYELEISSKPGGKVIRPGENIFEYEHGEEVELEAEAEDDHLFQRWSGEVENLESVESSTTVLTMENDYSITALFVEKAHLEVEIISPSAGDKFIEKEKVTIEYEITNTGELKGSQYIEIYFGLSVKERTYITLEQEETHEGEFTLKIEHPGELSLAISSEDDVDEISIQVLKEGIFRVDILEYDDEIRRGEESVVKYSVKNTGNFSWSQVINFVVYDDEDKEIFEKSIRFSLSPNEAKEDELNIELEEIGNYKLLIEGLEHKRTVETPEKLDISVEEEDTPGFNLPVLLLVSVIAMIIYLKIKKHREDPPKDSYKD